MKMKLVSLLGLFALFAVTSGKAGDVPLLWWNYPTAGANFFNGSQQAGVLATDGLGHFGTITPPGGSPTGAAGGILGGTYPNPTFGTFTSSTLAAALSDETGTGAAVFSTSPTLVTPALGVATATSLRTASSLGFNTGVGAGGTVTQATSRSTGVTLNTNTGVITGNNTSLAINSAVSFVVTDSAVAVADVPHIVVASGAPSTTLFYVTAVAAGSFTVTEWNTSSVTADTTTPVLNFVIIKGSSN